MQFKISVYKLFRHDYKRFGGEIMLYLNEEMPHKFLNNHLIVSKMQK